MYAYIYIYMYVCMYVHIYILIYIYIYTYIVIDRQVKCDIDSHTLTSQNIVSSCFILFYIGCNGVFDSV